MTPRQERRFIDMCHDLGYRDVSCLGVRRIWSGKSGSCGAGKNNSCGLWDTLDPQWIREHHKEWLKSQPLRTRIKWRLNP